MSRTFEQDLRLLWHRYKTTGEVPPFLAEAKAHAASGSLGPLGKTVAELLRRLRTNDRVVENAARRLGVLGWVVPMWAAREDVIRFAKLSDRAALDRSMARAYRRDTRRLRSVISGPARSEVLAKWRPLLRECEHLFWKGHQLTIVPALLLVLEGAIASTRTSTATSVKPTKALNLLVPEQLGSLRALWVSLEAFCELLYESTPFDKAVPRQLNRHWILHGRTSTRWTRLDAVRLYQALDTTAAILKCPTRA